jgi:exopolyphosphatase / guanosine-5'-triphosphate,3'-diphosphate pyrophosphatase
VWVTRSQAKTAAHGTGEGTVCVCDLGTYSGLILIARRSGTRWSVLLEERHTIDLLSDTPDRRLRRRAFERAAILLRRFDEIVAGYPDGRAMVVCTAAVRQAPNREALVNGLRRMIRCPIRVLSARQEAGFSAAGALIGLRPARRPTIVIDVGGGSTEVVFGRGARQRVWLKDWGAARATKHWKMLGKQPPSQRVETLTRMTSEIMGDIPVPHLPHRLVGVGGTIVTLAAIHAGLRKFDASRLHGMSLSTDWIARAGNRFARLDQAQIARLIPFDPERARVLAAGTILWTGVLNCLGADRIIVSTRGLRWGIASRLAEGPTV